MLNKKEFFSKIKHIISPNIPFVILFIMMLIVHSHANADFRDDVVNIQLINDNKSIVILLKLLRNSHSGRSIIDGILLSVLSAPIIIFRILNSMAYVLCAYSLSRFGKSKFKCSKWISVGLVLVFPASQMFACGWVTTSAVYLWPLSGLLFVLSIYPEALTKKHISIVNYILMVIFTVYSSNLEQCAAIIIGFSIVTLIYYWFVNNKILWVAVFQGLISIISFVYVLSAPGNENRTHAQVIANMPDFYHKSFVSKAYELFSYTTQEYLFGSNSAVIILCIICAYIIWNNYSNFITRFIGLFPLGVVMATGPLESLFNSVFPVGVVQSNYANGNIAQVSTYVTLFVSVLTWIVIGISIFLCMKDNLIYAFAMNIIYLAGFLSRMILVVTPSYLVSGYRTSVFLYFSILVIIFILVQNIFLEEYKYKKDFIVGTITLFSVSSYMSFCLSV